jgi:predicted transcriptional regulator
MIDALFGSKTRVKLLHLFLNNPGKSFYVRELTRIIEEQINSVRRELSNMMKIGIVNSEGSDNKLYYSVNTKYKYYAELKSIFDDNSKFVKPDIKEEITPDLDRFSSIKSLSGARLIIASGKLLGKSGNRLDLLIAGNVTSTKASSAVQKLEKQENIEITYSVLAYDEFYYRLSIRDKFIMDIVEGDRIIVVDKENLFKV